MEPATWHGEPLSVVQMKSVVGQCPLLRSAAVTLATVESTALTMPSKVFRLAREKLYSETNCAGASIGACVLCRARYRKKGVLAPYLAAWRSILSTAAALKSPPVHRFVLHW